MTRQRRVIIVYKKVHSDRWGNELAAWMKNNLAADSRVMVFDSPGVLAYYSDLKLLPVDGLINDYQYNDEITKYGINEYLQRKKIGYYLGPVKESSADYQEVEVFAPLYRQSAGKIRLTDEQRIFRIREVIPHPRAPNWAVWKLSFDE